MSVRQDQSSSGQYCSIDDVARYIKPDERGRDTFDSTTNLTETEVQKFIEKWSSRFDRRTGQSFGESQVIDETHDHDRLYYWLSGHPITVTKRNIITPLDSAKGDKMEVWTGNKWEDWVSDPNRDEGRDEDYWVDPAVGVIFIYERAILRPHPKFRLSYRYGTGDYVPFDVRDAVAAATAADLIMSDIYGANVPGNNNADNTDPPQAADRWTEQFKRTVDDYKKVRAIWD